MLGSQTPVDCQQACLTHTRTFATTQYEGESTVIDFSGCEVQMFQHRILCFFHKPWRWLNDFLPTNIRWSIRLTFRELGKLLETVPASETVISLAKSAGQLPCPSKGFAQVKAKSRNGSWKLCFGELSVGVQVSWMSCKIFRLSVWLIGKRLAV